MTKKKEETKKAPPLRVGSIFETMVGLYDCNVLPGWSEYNHEIIATVMKERIDNPEGVYRSNSAGTWHSSDKLFEKPELRRLQETEAGLCSSYIKACWRGKPTDKFKMRFQAWAMMYSKGGYATYHTHPNCHLSVVYFCHDSPEEEKVMATGVKVRPGDLEFVDTRCNEQHMLPNLVQFPTYRVTPKAGNIVVFPSWLPHFVHPVSGEKDRISIAANMTIMQHIRE